MDGEFDGCVAYIYDADGNILSTSKICEHNKSNNSIEVLSSQILLDNRRCSLFILSSPTPYACSGVIHPNGMYSTIRLFRGKEKENRSTKRYNIKGTASIMTYICEGKQYGLHRPIEAELMNISTTGVRFHTRFNTLSKNDRFSFHIKIVDNIKPLTAKVVNLKDIEQKDSEYGCTLTGKADGPIKL